MNSQRSLISFAAALVLIASLVAWPSPAPALADTATTFSGQATVLKGQLEGTSIGPLVDTGPVGPSGGALEASLLEYPIAGAPDPTNGALSGEVLHAAVVAGGSQSHAEATVASFMVTAAGQQIGATFLAATADATCNGSTASAAGRAEIAGLSINGQTVTLAGGVNETVPIPTLGAIIVNEQIGGASAQQGSVTVNALHITLTDPLTGKTTDLVVASAHADIVCGVPTGCANQDFITGGGWIVTSTGSRANFAVAAGKTPGWGHLLYIDHGGTQKVKGSLVTVYTLGPTPTSRHIEGNDQANGSAGTYQVDVSDNGNPGSLDTFGIVLSNGYTQPAVNLGGGNIKLHCK